MALQEQVLNINFSQGLETKTDPFQVQAGKFLSLENSVFDTGGRLTKRNGFGALTTLPVNTSQFLTTFNSDLTAIGQNLYAYSSPTNSWTNKGSLQPISLSTLPVVRSSSMQTQVDAAVSDVGSACIVYTDSAVGSNTYYYQVIDTTTGQTIINPTNLNASSTDGTPRVFLLENYFIIMFTAVVTATYYIKYIAISTTNPSMITSPVDIAVGYTPSSSVAWDALVLNNRLYIAYNTTSGGQSVKLTYLTTTLGSPVTPVTYSSEIATMFSLAADLSNPSSPILYVSYYTSTGPVGKFLSVDQNLNSILAPTTFTNLSLQNITSFVNNRQLTIYLEVINAYTYDSGIPTNYILEKIYNSSGTFISSSTLVRSVGLASKIFTINNTPYFLSVYSSIYQPSYFLINASTGQVVAKLAYSNGGGYLPNGLPSASVIGNIVRIPYLFKDLVQAASVTNTSATANVYTQTGVNLASFDFGISNISNGEIGDNLNLSGGYITAYDGVAPVEQGFFLWPDSIETTPQTTGGSMTDQQYYYQATYEWTDNQGNLFRSAPSIPAGANVSGSSGAGSVTVHIPTLRLTYKTGVRLVIYRWSAAQQNYYQVTSIASPTLNDPTVDSIDYVDTLNDSSIIGNNLIYTTGGVIENISPPASDLITLFNNRLWLVDAEDRNLLWYSKQVIESTPVEMSDLLTLYVAPTTRSEGSTGPITAIAPMDDKLIVFKQNALGYINGRGPDNTGANSQYSDFVLINSVVGCTVQNSIVFTPSGLMFQSNKGIWLLGRDLSTQYIGAPVEKYTAGATVKSALNIPSTNQVRFTLDSGVTLLYDYYYGQWGTFTNVPAVSSTIYEGLHTYVNSLGQVFQETPGVYLDNTSPVLMSFTTSWLNLAGVQGFERFKQLYLLGQYISPFNLNVQIAYDYNASPVQGTTVTPSQSVVTWGSGALWGSDGTWGGFNNPGWEGQANIFEARVFAQRQKCESFQISVTEVYNSSAGGMPGAGLTLSGMNIVTGIKRGFRTSRASRNFG